jgi:hypothetical protein
MMEKLRRGWRMASESYAVLRRYPRLAILPAISGAILLLVIGFILVSLMPQFGLLHNVTKGFWDRLKDNSAAQLWFFVGAFVGLYALTAIVLFFNVALVACALRVHKGEEPTLRSGLAVAISRLPQILGWALVAATVGLLLNILEGVLRENLGIIGNIIGGLFEVAWSVITYFVLPVLAAEGLGPIAAVRRSSAIVRSKWGESLAGEARFGLIGLLFFLIAAGFFFVGLALARGHGPAGMAGLGALLMAVGVILAIATIVVLQALSAIFLSGVYMYASTGKVPPALDRDLIESTFYRKA